MLILCAALGGFILDLIFGDPAWLPHPVVVMGKYISGFERVIRPRLPKTPRGELLGGALLAASLPLLTLTLTLGACLLARRVHWGVELALQTFWCAQALAARGLAAESRRVYDALRSGDLVAARTAVGRIVGRDTAWLDAEGVAKAAVETVAENTSDGVIAPMIFLAIGGPVLGFLYKAINTMDSMIGYKNDKYMYFGRAGAKTDDVVNFIPARLSALLMICAAFISGQDYDGHEATRIFLRDRFNHKSPNSAQTESVCAGALRIRLAGPASYFGKTIEKPYIGDDLRPVVYEDIKRACRLMYVTSFLCMIICTLIMVTVYLLSTGM